MPLLAASDFEDRLLQEFLAPQIRDQGGQVEIDEGLWALFAVPAHDAIANAIARSLLSVAPFPFDSGLSADEVWTLYYVNQDNRAAAVHWIHELPALLGGEIRPVSPAHKALIGDLIGSDKPHRAAQRLADLHEQGEISAGLVRDPATVRALLDRLHQREPLAFAALLLLLNHHLVDLVVLHRQLIPEDIDLKNEILGGGISRDPFLQTRQAAVAEIRNLLIRYRLINPLDQQKNATITNPYVGLMELVMERDRALLPVDGVVVPVPLPQLVGALRAIRRNLYGGGVFSHIDTQVPWVTKEIALPFRFIRQRVASRGDLSVMDVLYMLERAAGG